MKQMPSTTRRGFLTMSTALAAMLAACGTKTDKTTGDAASAGDVEDSDASTSTKRETIECTEGGAHAIAVSGSAEKASYTATDVVKTGDDDGDEADFYGTNAAVYAEEGATLDLTDVTVTTDGAHANAVFSYGEGTTITISDSEIVTSNNCSGGIMVTGGGTLKATDLTIHTSGNSSAAIRSDRGGGIQDVTGGEYATAGTGSPVIYSTADVTVRSATLTSTASQGVVVEGKNSVTLADCKLTADNHTKNSDKSAWYQAVMIYQSMSGDAAEGKASFSMSGGSLDNRQGDILFVNNTVADITFAGVSVTNQDTAGVFLRACAAGWGNEGSNGGHVTLTTTAQEVTGDLVLDEVSELNCYLTQGSSLTGAVNAEGAGKAYVELDAGSTWTLTGDSVVEGLTCDESAITLSGHTLTVGGVPYVEGTASTGTALEFTVAESTGGPGNTPPDGGMGHPGDKGGEPPAKPDGASGEPPAKPDGASGEPPAKPGEAGSSSVSETTA